MIKTIPRTAPSTLARGATALGGTLGLLLCLGLVACNGGSSSTPATQGTTHAAPTITIQPADQTVVAGAVVTYSVTATGDPAPTYQWQRMAGGAWTDIPGATAPSGSFTAGAERNGEKLQVVVSNSEGKVTSRTATLSVNAAPTFGTQPMSQTVGVLGSATFKADATAPGTLSYQWRKDDQDIPGATSPTLTLSGQTLAPGAYRVLVTSALGSTAVSAASDAATLVVVALPVITGFSAIKSPITANKTTKLRVAFSGGDGTVDFGAGPIPVTTGDMDTPPLAQDATFILTVTHPVSGTVSASTSVRVVAPPTLTAFTATPAILTTGDTATLHATYSGGTATLVQTLPAIVGAPALTPDSNGDVLVRPGAGTTTYTITVKNEAGDIETATRTATVKAVARPRITAFVSVPRITEGDPFGVDFGFFGGSGVLSGPGIAPSIELGTADNTYGLAGHQDIVPGPTAFQPYRLTVTNEAGTAVTQDLLVDVVKKPLGTRLTPSLSQITVGTTCDLTATWVDGTARIFPGNLEVKASPGTITVKPTVDTTYTLVVTNPMGVTDASQTTTVTLGTGHLSITAKGLADKDASGNVITGPNAFTLGAKVKLEGANGFVEDITSFTGTLDFAGLADGDYTLTAGTVEDSRHPGLGRTAGGPLGPQYLQRYPQRPVQKVTISQGGTGAATINYPDPVTSVYIGTTLDLNDFPMAPKDLSLDFVLIPAGEFRMGSGAEVDNLAAPYAGMGYEGRIVKFEEAFYMSRTEVPATFYGVALVPNGTSTSGIDYTAAGYVTWDQANDFFNGLWPKVNGMTLPTEAQWEYACRGGTNTAYFFGDGWEDLNKYAYAYEPGQTATKAVSYYLDLNFHLGSNYKSSGLFPNPYGLFDMLGNGFEWCQDAAHDTYQGAPVDGTAVTDASTSVRIARGGGFLSGADTYAYTRSAHRNWMDKGTAHHDSSFRAVMPVPAPQ